MKFPLTPALFFLLMIITEVGFAQNLDSEKSVSSLFKLNFFLPGISYEQKLAQYQTLHFSGYLDAVINTQSTNGGSHTDIYLLPTVAFEIRSYYNLNKRDRKGLRTDMNSGNYLAPVYIGRYSHREDFDSELWIHLIGAVWGIQRTALSGFSFELNLGAGYSFADQETEDYNNTFEPIIQIALGYRIGKREDGNQ